MSARFDFQVAVFLWRAMQSSLNFLAEVPLRDEWIMPVLVILAMLG